MTTISAQVITDSISPQNIRLTTLQLRYPRFIHSEMMTHRVFSRNASSSRAIPVSRLIEDVERDPAMPIHWGKNQAGMQAREELTYDALKIARLGWVDALRNAVFFAKELNRAGAHKQIVNRLLEPFSHINVVVSSTEWQNFFALRLHPDAQPEIRELANQMYEAMQNSMPVPLRPGEWHLPYVDVDRELGWIAKQDGWWRARELGRMVSAARCARVSYLTHEGKKPDLNDDLKLYHRLVDAIPPHMSPLEHQATPDWTFYRMIGVQEWNSPDKHGNFTGWIQHRHLIPNESVRDR